MAKAEEMQWIKTDQRTPPLPEVQLAIQAEVRLAVPDTVSITRPGDQSQATKLLLRLMMSKQACKS